MSERWRDELNRLRNRRLVFWAVVISFVLHLVFVLVLFFLPSETLRPSDTEKPIWIDAADLDLGPKSPGHLVTTPLPANERAPDRADHLARSDNAVEKEMHRADLPINENMSEVGPKSPRSSSGTSRIEKKYTMPRVGESMTSKGGKGATEDNKAGEGAGKTGKKSLDDLVNSIGYSTERTAKAGGGGNLSPYNPDVGEAGNAISLNTKNFKYYGYFSGLKEKIEWAWVYPQEAQMMGQQGMLTLSFTILRSGQLKEIKQLKSSGFPLLDRAAKRAIEDAADFATFPESWPDQEITIVANFSYQLIGAKSVF